MKLIGLLGGMSWESTQVYYRLLNELTQQRLGGLHSARCVLHSVDFAQIEALQHAEQWDAAGEILISAAQGLERAGAECLVICTNTMHLLAESIQSEISIPVLHIADATGNAIKQAGLDHIGLLATAFTMEKAFYRQRLEQSFNLQVSVPDQVSRKLVHDIIYQELCLGNINSQSKNQYIEVVQVLQSQGIQGLILGCTEICLLINQSDIEIPVFDSTALHVTAAVDFALKEVI